MATRYEVHTGESLLDLELAVNQSLESGWKLVGGIVVHRSEEKDLRKGHTEVRWLWAQAMYKEETDNG